MANPVILPRQGEVSPKVTKGEDATTAVFLSSPSVWQGASHLPLAGEDRTVAAV